MVKVYSTTNCKFCKLAKLFLDSNGVKHEYLNIDNDEVAKAEFDKLEALGAPVIVIDDEVFRGFNPTIQVQIANKLNL